MFVPKKTVGQMVSEAQAKIENLTNEQLRAEIERDEVQVVDIRKHVTGEAAALKGKS